MTGTKKKMAMFAAVLLCLALILAVAGCAPKEEEEIVLKIGNVGPRTGDYAAYGTNVFRGIEIAVEEANASGELGDIKLKLISEDTGGDPTAAANAFTKLIEIDNVDVIIGAVLSGETATGGPIVMDACIPTISPSSTAKDLTKGNPYLFRNCLSDDAQIEQMAEYAAKDLELSKFAILYTNNDYGVSLKDSFVASAEGLADIVAVEVYMDKDESFKTQLTSIKSKNPDCLYIAGYYPEAAKIAQQAKEMGLDVPLLGPDGLCNVKYIEIGEKEVEGTYTTSGFYPDDPTTAVKDFVRTFQEKYGEEPDMFGATAYDAARIVIEAIKNKGVTMQHIKEGTASELIREGISATRDFPGITGKTSIDDEGESIKGIFILKVEGGKFVLAKSPV